MSTVKLKFVIQKATVGDLRVEVFLYAQQAREHFSQHGGILITNKERLSIMNIPCLTQLHNSVATHHKKPTVETFSTKADGVNTVYDLMQECLMHRVKDQGLDVPKIEHERERGRRANINRAPNPTTTITQWSTTIGPRYPRLKSKKQIILELMLRKKGANSEEMMDATALSWPLLAKALDQLNKINGYGIATLTRPGAWPMRFIAYYDAPPEA